MFLSLLVLIAATTLNSITLKIYSNKAQLVKLNL